MLVSQILKSKSVSDVITARSDATVQNIAETLSRAKIGAVIISDDGATVAGIVSERDIVREIGARGPACLTDPVSKIMTRKVIACTQDQRAYEISERMTEGRFRHMPVVENGRLIGLISIGDVVKARLSELAMEKDALEGMIKGF